MYLKKGQQFIHQSTVYYVSVFRGAAGESRESERGDGEDRRPGQRLLGGQWRVVSRLQQLALASRFGSVADDFALPAPVQTLL